MNFKKTVVEKIINIFETNQEYFTNNLPQAAKLGYILEKLHKVYLVCYGDTGIIKKARYQDSVREMLERSDINQNNDKLYSAWSQHIGFDEHTDFPSYLDLINLIFFGQPLTDLELLEIKPKKTFDEWVEIQMQKYPLSNSSRLNVAARMLFMHSSGEYTYKDGFVEGIVSYNIFRYEYGDWKNAVLPYEIQELLKIILSFPEVKTAYKLTYEVMQKRVSEKSERDVELDELKQLIAESNKVLREKGVDLTEYEKQKEEQKNDIVIIHSKDSIINKLDSETDNSYVKAAIEICLHIMKYKDTYYSPKGLYAKDNKKLLQVCENFLNNKFVSLVLNP